MVDIKHTKKIIKYIEEDLFNDDECLCDTVGDAAEYILELKEELKLYVDLVEKLQKELPSDEIKEYKND